MIRKNKIKVLVVDDSALIRQTLTTIISANEHMEVIATASDPYLAVSKMKSEKPDVITLDIQMPRMDGLTFLKKIMTQHPIPVIIVSSLTKAHSDMALSAFKLGALDVMEKPIMSSDLLRNEWKEKLIENILTAASSKLPRFNTNTKKSIKPIHNSNVNKSKENKICNNFIFIGSSAGGTEVINQILSQLDVKTAPILIVQHMPAQFTSLYAVRLNNNSQLNVKEAASGDELFRGTALIAPGDKHMEINNNGFNFFVDINSKPKLNRHRPSVDMLFNSALKYTGIKKMAIILSGMGNDGSVSMLKLKNIGAITIAQDSESSIVYGMPKEALKTGAATHSLSIEEIIKEIKNFSKNQ